MEFTVEKTVVLETCKTGVAQYQQMLMQSQTQYEESNTKYNFWASENQSKLALLNMSGGMNNMADMIRQELDQLGANPDTIANLRRKCQAITHLIHDFQDVMTIAQHASSIVLTEADNWIFNGERRCHQYEKQLESAEVEPVHA
ncbi:MAG: hypothetical protein ACYTDT_00410 [Planctomycetota bacterium]|jgi:hypothetical protein